MGGLQFLPPWAGTIGSNGNGHAKPTPNGHDMPAFFNIPEGGFRLLRSLLFAVSLGVIVGALIFMLWPREHRLSAGFAPSADASDIKPYRTMLLEQACNDLDPSDTPLSQWRIRSDGPDGLLKIEVASPDRRHAATVLEAMAGAYAASIKKRYDAELARPTEVEALLAGQVGRLRHEVKTARRIADDLSRRLPDADPRVQYDQHIKELRTLQASVSQLRLDIDKKGTLLAEAENLTPATEPKIDPAERTVAEQRNGELGQLRAELGMHANKIRSHLLGAWKDSRLELSNLIRTAHDVRGAAEKLTGTAARNEQADAVESFTLAAMRYETDLGEFAGTWRAEFSPLMEEADAQDGSPEVLDFVQRIGMVLEAFQVVGEKSLGIIDGEVGKISDTSVRQSAGFVPYAKLSSEYAALRSAHNTFAGAASQVLPERNFRLDATCRTARGLRSRLRHCRAQVDEALRERKTYEAKLERQEAVASLTAELSFLRGERDRLMADMLDVQDRIIADLPWVENYKSTLAAIEAADDYVGTLTERVDRLEAERSEAAKMRTASVDPSAISFAGVVVHPDPLNANVYTSASLSGGMGSALVALSLVFAWTRRREAKWVFNTTCPTDAGLYQPASEPVRMGISSRPRTSGSI